MQFICTFNASKVTFIHFLFEWRIARSFYQKTIWTDVKLLDSSVFKTEFELNFGFPHIPSAHVVIFTNTLYIICWCELAHVEVSACNWSFCAGNEGVFRFHSVAGRGPAEVVAANYLTVCVCCVSLRFHLVRHLLSSGISFTWKLLNIHAFIHISQFCRDLFWI